MQGLLLNTLRFVFAQGLQADVDGSPEVTVVLNSKKLLEGVVTHPCVSSVDAALVNLVPGTSQKISFVPTPHPFALCHYKVHNSFCQNSIIHCAGQIVPSEAYIPIRGFYQMKVALSCKL